ncbi:glutathione S-transferase family protein [Dokdonella sp.]|uniref:glutathione S-transferase family protein n=1 Tax=Dokdonella sp. TaxID=2291710 RepID=UPI003C528567
MMNLQAKPVITVFEHSPDEGKGMARDMRVRWALEEVGQRYDVRPVSFASMKEAAHRSHQPFGQIPTYEDGDLILFESGAIVLHIANHHTGLLPQDADARARATSWVFAALSTIEPPIVEREVVEYCEREESWFEQRMSSVDDRLRNRLKDLSHRLGEADWLDGAFSVGDLMTIDVLRRLAGSGLLEEFANLLTYVARGEARPAFKRAFNAQLACFNAASTDCNQSPIANHKESMK